jgi:hypothetical protein
VAVAVVDGGGDVDGVTAAAAVDDGVMIGWSICCANIGGDEMSSLVANPIIDNDDGIHGGAMTPMMGNSRGH